MDYTVAKSCKELDMTDIISLLIKYILIHIDLYVCIYFIQREICIYTFICAYKIYKFVFVYILFPFISIISQFSSVTQSSLTPCDSMNRSTPGLPVHHKLLEFTQTHAHRVSDAIQPSHPLSPPSPPAPIPPSIRLFSNESILCMRWPKYWSSVSASVLPRNTQG